MQRKNYRTFYSKNCHNALKNMGLVSGIRDPGPGKSLFRILDPGSRGQKGTGSRIRIATLSDTLILICRLKSVISTKLSHIESWFFLTVFSTHTPCQSEKLVRLELKRQLWHFFKKWLSFRLSEEVKYKYDELKLSLVHKRVICYYKAYSLQLGKNSIESVQENLWRLGVLWRYLIN
jgi:hypothetical protein